MRSLSALRPTLLLLGLFPSFVLLHACGGDSFSGAPEASDAGSGSDAAAGVGNAAAGNAAVPMAEPAADRAPIAAV